MTNERWGVHGRFYWRQNKKLVPARFGQFHVYRYEILYLRLSQLEIIDRIVRNRRCATKEMYTLPYEILLK